MITSYNSYVGLVNTTIQKSMIDFNMIEIISGTIEMNSSTVTNITSSNSDFLLFFLFTDTIANFNNDSISYVSTNVI